MRYQPNATPSLSRLFDRFFDDDVFGPAWATLARPSWAPLNVRDAGEAFEVELSLPGVKPEAIEVQLQRGVLSVKAAEQAESEAERDGYLVREIKRGGVVRAVQLPAEVDADKVEATYEHGVLKLH